MSLNQSTRITYGSNVIEDAIQKVRNKFSYGPSVDPYAGKSISPEFIDTAADTSVRSIPEPPVTGFSYAALKDYRVNVRGRISSRETAENIASMFDQANINYSGGQKTMESFVDGRLR